MEPKKPRCVRVSHLHEHNGLSRSYNYRACRAEIADGLRGNFMPGLLRIGERGFVVDLDIYFSTLKARLAADVASRRGIGDASNNAR